MFSVNRYVGDQFLGSGQEQTHSSSLTPIIVCFFDFPFYTKDSVL